jgi:hypothetical protein
LGKSATKAEFGNITIAIALSKPTIREFINMWTLMVVRPRVELLRARSIGLILIVSHQSSLKVATPTA